MEKLKLNLNADFVFKESGELPEEFYPYLVVYKNKQGGFYTMIGVYEPHYDNGNGGFYDGVMAHLEFSSAYAWLCLGNVTVESED